MSLVIWYTTKFLISVPCVGIGISVDDFKLYNGADDQPFSRIFEINRDPVADDRLNLPNAPFGLAWVADENAGQQSTVHCMISTLNFWGSCPLYLRMGRNFSFLTIC